MIRNWKKAVALVMDFTQEESAPGWQRPVFPNYHTGQPTEGPPAAGGASGNKH